MSLNTKVNFATRVVRGFSGARRLVAGLALALGCGAASAQRPLGTDVSHYQTTINWTTVKNAGVTFAWAKATEVLPKRALRRLPVSDGVIDGFGLRPSASRGSQAVSG